MFELNDAAHDDHMVSAKSQVEFIESEIEQRQHKAASKVGFVIQDHSLYLYGICKGMQDHGHCSMKKNAA